jgi:phosphatidylglycerophosphate synthase
MNKNSKKLISKIFLRSERLYNFKNESFIVYLMFLISNLVTPIFFYLNISPNFITGINFILSLILIYIIFTLDPSIFMYAIILYFIIKIFDFCDGSIARYKNISTFYGRFLDSILDIFIESSLILCVHYFTYKIFNNESLFIFGIFSALFSIYGSSIADKYSALVRWTNEENKTKIKPYLRKFLFPRLNYTLLDIWFLSLFLLPFTLNNNLNFVVLLSVFTFLTFAQNIIIILKHIYFARNNLRKLAKDKI